jgi:RNase H-fold protein (predicted Holliday junction resolvase)
MSATAITLESAKTLWDDMVAEMWSAINKDVRTNPPKKPIVLGDPTMTSNGSQTPYPQVEAFMKRLWAVAKLEMVSYDESGDEALVRAHRRIQSLEEMVDGAVQYAQRCGDTMKTLTEMIDHLQGRRHEDLTKAIEELQKQAPKAPPKE